MKITSASAHHPLHVRRRTLSLPLSAQRFIAAFEGLEGGFAIGASIVVALSLADLDRHIILVTAILSIVVSGFNTASVKYSTEHYLDELDGREKHSALKHYFIPAFIEFFSYFVISLFSIVPLLLIHNIQIAVTLSVILTLVILCAAGYWRAYIVHMPRWRDALETMLIGAAIIAVGIISGIAIRLL